MRRIEFWTFCITLATALIAGFGVGTWFLEAEARRYANEAARSSAISLQVDRLGRFRGTQENAAPQVQQLVSLGAGFHELNLSHLFIDELELNAPRSRYPFQIDISNSTISNFRMSIQRQNLSMPVSTSPERANHLHIREGEHATLSNCHLEGLTISIQSNAYLYIENCTLNRTFFAMEQRSRLIITESLLNYVTFLSYENESYQISNANGDPDITRRMVFIGESAIVGGSTELFYSYRQQTSVEQGAVFMPVIDLYAENSFISLGRSAYISEQIDHLFNPITCSIDEAELEFTPFPPQWGPAYHPDARRAAMCSYDIQSQILDQLIDCLDRNGHWSCPPGSLRQTINRIIDGDEAAGP